MKKLAILILFVAQFGWGADEPLIARVYQLKYADPQGLIHLLKPFLSPPLGYAEFDKNLKALSINVHKEAFPGDRADH